MNMKNIYKIVLMAGALMAGLSACSLDEPVTGVEPQKVSPVSADAVAGELLVRFDEGVSEILDKAGLITKSGEVSATRSGVLSVDEVLDLVEGYQIERVFPVDARSEAKVRQDGLHLWYVVRFSDEHPVEKVAADLAQLGEVSRVEFNRTLKRASDTKAVPLTKSAMEQMKNSARQAKFNDPHLGLQWHMVNNGDLGATKFVAGADVNVERAWDLCMGDPSIIVAVLDEGVDFSHPDLKNSMWINEGEIWRSTEDNDGNGYAGDVYGYNFAAGSGIVSTNGRYDTGHGTHVAGVIAAISPLASIIAGISSAIGVLSKAISFIVANPIVLLIAAIVALVALIATKGDQIQAVLKKVDSFLQNIFAKDWSEQFGILGEGLNAFFAIVKGVWDSIKQVFDGIINFIRGIFTGDWKRAWEGVKQIFSGVFNALVTIAKAPLNLIIGVINGLISGINLCIDGLNRISIKIPDWVPVLGGKNFGFNLSHLGKIAYLAQGGVLSSGSAIVGEAGAELLTMSNGRAVVQPLTNNTANHNYGGITMNIYGAAGQSVQELAEIIMDEIGDATRRREAAL